MRLGLVATALVAIQAPQVEAASPETITIGLKVLEGIRGAWLGFNRGLYKRANSSPMNANCMDEEASNNLTSAIHQFSHDGVVEGDWFDALGNLTLVAANLTNCKFREPFTDIWHFCKEAKE